MYFIIGILLGILAALLYQKLERYRQEQAANRHLKELAAAIESSQAPTPADMPRLRRRLDIEGTQQGGLDASLLHTWGIQKDHVQDVATIVGPAKLDELPEGVMDCLAMCFCQSKTRGVEINELLKTGNLDTGKKLYFVLSEPELGKPTITALVS